MPTSFKAAANLSRRLNLILGRLAVGQCLIAALALLMILSCASLAGKNRLSQFEEVARRYKWSLESSEYQMAAKFMDPAVKRPAVDYDRYANIKIARYKITNIEVSDDRLSIEQDVEMHYFLLDRNVLKTIKDHQVWHYKDTDNVWMLQTGLPIFPR